MVESDGDYESVTLGVYRSTLNSTSSIMALLGLLMRSFCRPD
jgi:hypothetical protein